jgi:zinc protease
MLAAACLLVWSAAHAAVRPPRLQYRESRLPNGLRLIVSEDHSTPIVNVQLWYHVGSKDERAGRTGFAHLFEHLMFKGSKNVEPEGHTSLVSSVGGQSNAYTTEDVTVYWNTVPSHYLPLVLWLEADRMAALRVDAQTFDREREIVKEERRQRVENPPYGRLSEIIYRTAFTVHPYRHQPIGAMADLEAASIADVRDFYRTYYVPSNCTVAIVGDVDPAQAEALVEQYFGRIPKPARGVPREIPAEPAKTKERRVTVEESWPLPVVVIAHHVTYDGHPDSYPLHMASKILSDGQSSRIHRRLVYESGLALTAFGGGNLVEHPNLFFAVAIVQPDRNPADAEKALVDELQRLRTTLVSERELERAKNQFARDYVTARQTVQEKAAQLAHAAVVHEDVSTADGEYDTFMRTTAADIQRVADTYFKSSNRLVLTVLPRERPRSEP